jgi:hypothetical protein
VTEFDRLRLQVRTLTRRNDALEARLVALEAAQCARPARSKREAAPRPDSAVVDENRALWAAYLEAEMKYGHGRVRKLTKGFFAMRHSITPSEFYRLFSYSDKRGIPPGSGPFVRMRGALTAATAELENSHGRLRSSQTFPAKSTVSSAHVRDGRAAPADRGRVSPTI